jgi:ABC-type transport system involved in Fe-S cluster assembly fused permease/ATPase subunit
MKTTSKGRTTIFISYRVPTVRNAARIVELGTHDELITLNGSTPTCITSNYWKRNLRS